MIDRETFDEMVEAMEASDPHGEDAITISISTLVAHIEVCQGLVALSFHPKVAKGIRDYLTTQLEQSGQAEQPAWATDLDTDKGN